MPLKSYQRVPVEPLRGKVVSAGAADRNTLIIAGDDAGAKRTATEFLAAIGYDAYDSGPLSDSWRFERDQPAYVWAYVENGDFANRPHLLRRTSSLHCWPKPPADRALIGRCDAPCWRRDRTQRAGRGPATVQHRSPHRVLP